jgi:hypothetical protein
MGGCVLDTSQLTVQCASTIRGDSRSIDYSDSVIRATEQLTVQSTIASELNEQLDNPICSDRSELGNSTTGTDEGTQLKARLA